MSNAKILSYLLKELKVPITRKSISDELDIHPNPDSLLAMSDLMDNWKVPNGAYTLSFDELINAKIPGPFLTNTKDDEFVVVNELTPEHTLISGANFKRKKLSKLDFEKLYGGSILIAEKDKESGENNYRKNYLNQLNDFIRLPAFVLGVILLIILNLAVHFSFIHNLTWQIGLVTLYKSVGLVITLLLLAESIDSNNSLVQKFCGPSNDGKGCNSILASDAAKLTENLSWSEIGFFYFAGTWLIAILNGTDKFSMQILALLNLVSLPYTIYSIYYQWRVAKQWCFFCCTVQALLWLEFVNLVPFIFHGLVVPTFGELVTVLTCMMTPLLIWIFVKPYLENSRQLQSTKLQLSEFKYNIELFEKLLHTQPIYSLLDEENSLIIGNRDAEKVITMISDPYCGPCSHTHGILDEWIEKRNDIKLQLVFSTANDRDSIKAEVVSHLFNLKTEIDPSTLKVAINDWYGINVGDYEEWAKKYPVKSNLINTQTLKIQSEWCDITDTHVTPTIFINGRRLPENYAIEDVKYLL